MRVAGKEELVTDEKVVWIVMYVLYNYGMLLSGLLFNYKILVNRNWFDFCKIISTTLVK